MAYDKVTRYQRCTDRGHVGDRRLPVTDFHRRKRGGRRSSRCRFCTARAQKQWRDRRADTQTASVTSAGRMGEVFTCRMPSMADDD